MEGTIRDELISRDISHAVRTNGSGEVGICLCKFCEGLPQISRAHGRSRFSDRILELHDLDARCLRDADPAPIANRISDFGCSARCDWCVFGGESLNGNCAESCRGDQQFQRNASGPRIVVR